MLTSLERRFKNLMNFMEIGIMTVDAWGLEGLAFQGPEIPQVLVEVSLFSIHRFYLNMNVKNIQENKKNGDVSNVYVFFYLHRMTC